MDDVIDSRQRRLCLRIKDAVSVGNDRHEQGLAAVIRGARLTGGTGSTVLPV
jgi:hypothetical protein